MTKLKVQTIVWIFYPILESIWLFMAHCGHITKVRRDSRWSTSTREEPTSRGNSFFLVVCDIEEPKSTVRWIVEPLSVVIVCVHNPAGFTRPTYCRQPPTHRCYRSFLPSERTMPPRSRASEQITGRKGGEWEDGETKGGCGMEGNLWNYEERLDECMSGPEGSKYIK